MGLTFLQQLMTVACLAFSSGLLLAFALLRGEIGAMDRRSARRHEASAPSMAPRRPKRRRFSLSKAREAVVSALTDIDPALMWVLIALALMLSASALITRLAD